MKPLKSFRELSPEHLKNLDAGRLTAWYAKTIIDEPIADIDSQLKDMEEIMRSRTEQEQYEMLDNLETFLKFDIYTEKYERIETDKAIIKRYYENVLLA